MTWVIGDGPYNEHLVRDFGSLNLALAIVLGVAVWKGGRVLVRTAAAAYLAFGVPHLVYHLRHTNVLEGFARTSSLSSLTAAVLLAGGALVLPLRKQVSTDAI
jgi:hypothetical protein